MMVSTRGRYALRLMIDIAKQGEAAKPADQIHIGDVLRATEGSCMPVACVDDEGKCDLAGCCEARGFWRGMGNAINAYIDRITLADVLEGNVEA